MSVNKVNSDGSLSRVAGGTLYADLPIGSWVKNDSDTIPSGFLKAGDTISQTLYPELYAMYGSTVPYKADTSELDDFEEPFDPNIASIVTTGVTAQYDGFLYVNGFAPYSIEGSRTISINGETVVSLTRSSGTLITQNFCLSIKKGDVIKGSASNYLGSWVFRYYKKSLIVKAKQVAVPFDLAEYIRNQNVLSEWETFTATSSAKLTCLYDGELVFKDSNTGWGDIIGTIYVNDVKFDIPSAGGSQGFIYTISVKKGDVVYGMRDIKGGVARWYKLRDYTGR